MALVGDFFNQPSMASGEIGPELYGRIDQELYFIGLRTCRNFIVRQYGGASNRPGTRFISEAKDSSKQIKLLPFQFNEIQTYVMEFGEQSLRIIMNGGEVLESAKIITGATNAAQVVITSNAHGFANGEDVYLTGMIGMIELNGRTVRVSDQTLNTFKIKDFQGNYISSAAYGVYTSGGTASRIYTVTTPWLASDLFEMNYAQSADVITIVHPDYAPRDITRTAHNAWTVTTFDAKRGPFKDINTTSRTVYASAASGSVTITASGSLFTNDDIGTLFYIEQNPDDDTKVWEVQKGIRQDETRRAGFNYYMGPTATSIKNITAVAYTSSKVTLTSAAHGFSNEDIIYITGVGGATELNDQFYKVADSETNTMRLKDINGNYINSAGFTAYTSGGTMETAWVTGTLKPDHTEGSARDGDPGVLWDYLHSGFGIVQITAVGGPTSATATVITRLPARVVGSGNATENWAKAAWSATEGYPSAVTYHKQRLIFGGSNLQPNTLWFSNSGLRTQFGTSNPILDDESITISLDTNQVNAVRHLLSLSQLIVLTSSSEHLISGKDGSLLATEPPSALVQGYNGSNRVHPIIVGNTALYVEDTGDVVRSLQYDLQSDSFTGIDLTARSPHLFRNKQIVDWAYQKRPLSVVWTVMNDGALNGFTFMPEQKVYAWHRHDTRGTYESVCCIREGDETAAYLATNRVINGTVRRYTERFASRYFADVRDAFFVDCGLTYDGRNSSVTTITASGGTTWDNPEVLTLTASNPIFLATDVGDEITFVGTNGVTYRLTISTYSSQTVVLAIPTKQLAADYRNIARTDWNFARRRFKNFWHLEGEAVVALSDGNHVPDLVVTNGVVTLPDPGAVVHIGEAYTAELETLDIAQDTRSGSLKAKSVNIPRVFLTAQESRAIFVAANVYGSTGNLAADGFIEAKQRTPEMGYDPAIPAQTRVFEVLTQGQWSNRGRVCVRAPYPLPVTINCITVEVPIGVS